MPLVEEVVVVIEAVGEERVSRQGLLRENHAPQRLTPISEYGRVRKPENLDE